MMYLLDTDVLSELRKVKAGKAHPNVVAWNGSISPSQSFISVISVLEIERGILRLERRDMAQGEVMRNWFEQRVLPAFTDRVLATDAAVARRGAARSSMFRTLGRNATQSSRPPRLSTA